MAPISGHVYLRDGDFYVSLRIAGAVEADVMGPFDDETDALMAAERQCDGQIYLPERRFEDKTKFFQSRFEIGEAA